MVEAMDCFDVFAAGAHGNAEFCLGRFGIEGGGATGVGGYLCELMFCRFFLAFVIFCVWLFNGYCEQATGLG